MAAPSAGFSRAIIKYGLRKAAEGQKLLEQQDGYDLIQPCLDQVLSKKQSLILKGLERPGELATTTSNRFGKVIREFVAALTDIKPFFEIKTFNHKFDHQAEISGKLSTYWYTNSHADQRGLATALRWAAVGGTGYIHLRWDPKIQDLVADGIDPRDILPIGPIPPWDTCQPWEGLIIRERRTVEYVQDLADPDTAKLITEDRAGDEGGPLSSTRAGRILAEINAQARSPLSDVLFSDQPKTDIGRQPQVDLFTMYLHDRAKNTGDKPIEMGQFMEDPTWVRTSGVMGYFEKAPRIPENSWSYLVKPGQDMYPRLRMVVFTRSAVVYDGPSIYWHGKFPVLKLTPDPWPTSILGLAPGWDLLSLQNSLDWNLRVIDDHNGQVAQPAAIADEMTIGLNALKAVNTRKPGLKILQNPMGKGVQIVLPPPLDNSIREHIDWIMREMDDLSGVIDLKNLSSLNQLPSTETVDKMIESKSWLLQGRSRVIEAFMREFAEQLISNFAQFYTVKMRYTILGPNGLTAEDFDFDPRTFIPDFVHPQDFDEFGGITAEALSRGPLPVYDRYKEISRHLHFFAAPGSMLNGADATRKMLYLQLWRSGFPIDVWSLAETLGISNFGAPPDGATNMIQRWVVQQSMGIQSAPSPANPANPAPGHPPTAQTPPHLQGKPGGDSTIAESKGGTNK